jgi:virulence-associated protein VapD
MVTMVRDWGQIIKQVGPRWLQASWNISQHAVKTLECLAGIGGLHAASSAIMALARQLVIIARCARDVVVYSILRKFMKCTLMSSHPKKQNFKRTTRSSRCM